MEHIACIVHIANERITFFTKDDIKDDCVKHVNTQKSTFIAGEIILISLEKGRYIHVHIIRSHLSRHGPSINVDRVLTFMNGHDAEQTYSLTLIHILVLFIL